MDTISVKDIFQNAKCDPDLVSAINIDDLMNAVENDKNEHLDNKTLANIAEDKYKQLKSLHLTKEHTKELFSKLMEYRAIDEIHQLHKGKHVRWIRTNTLNPKNNKIENNRIYSKPKEYIPTLTAGGIVVDIKFLDTGTHIMVLTKNPRIPCIQYNFDHCITFQKLSAEEQLILAAYEYIQENT